VPVQFTLVVKAAVVVIVILLQSGEFRRQLGALVPGRATDEAPREPQVRAAPCHVVRLRGDLFAWGAPVQAFFSLRVFTNLFTDNAFLGLCAVGMTFVILSGGIDLSVGAMVAFSSTLIASLTQLAHFLPFPAIALVLVIGLLFGLAQGA